MNVNRTVAALALAGAFVALPVASQAQIAISVNIAPPILPVYDQPICPGDGYLWTPGYWAWDAGVSDYYWVPGTWVEAPQPGFLWTPGYWGFVGGTYLWHVGYWGSHIGFYGGVNYGFGYGGFGYEGGYWNGGHFFYNTAISRVNVNVIHNTYVHNVTVVNNTRVAFNGGAGGTMARPSAGEQAAFRENHIAPTGVQMQHANFARQDRSQFASTNHGQPPAAAMARPAQSAGAFHGGNVVPGGRPAVAAGTTNTGGAMQQRNGFANTGGNTRPGAPASIGAPSGGFEQRPKAQSMGQPAAQPTARNGFGSSESKAPVKSMPAPQARPAAASHPAPQQHAAQAEHGGEHR